MKKVIRLTESDLVRIVKRVIKEQAPTDVYNQSSMGRVSNEPRMGRAKSNEFDWKSHFDQIKNELDSYLNTIEGPVDVKRFQRKVMNTYYQMVSNVDDEYSYPSHGRDFQQLTTDFMSYFTNKLKELIQNYGKLTESDLARIVKRVIQENEGIPLFIRRREKKISEIMDEIVNDPDNDPMNFSDEFEYADNILNWTIQTMRGVFGDDMVEQEENDIIGHLKEMYGDHLFDIYNSQVEPEDDDLLEANLARIVKRVIQEQVTKGRNNPRWIKLFNVLRNIGSPKVLTFKDFDGNPSQSLNWGTTKTSNADYGLAASDAHESFYLMSDNKQLLSSLFKWWSNKGYKTDVIGGEVMINFDNVDKISSDLQNFFKSFSPVGKMSIK